MAVDIAWVARLDCGHDIGGKGTPPEVEIETVFCLLCTNDPRTLGKKYRRVAQIVTAAPERDAQGRV